LPDKSEACLLRLVPALTRGLALQEIDRLEAEKSALLDYVQEAEAVKQGHETQLARMQEAAESIGYKAAAAGAAKTKAAEAESKKLRNEVQVLTEEVEELQKVLFSKEEARTSGSNPHGQSFEELSVSYTEKVRELEEISGMQVDLVNMVQEANMEKEQQKGLITELQQTIVDMQEKFGSNKDGLTTELEELKASHNEKLSTLKDRAGQMDEMVEEKEKLLRENLKLKLYEEEIQALRQDLEESHEQLEKMSQKEKKEAAEHQGSDEIACADEMRAMQGALDKAQKSVEEALAMKAELAGKRKEVTEMEMRVADAEQAVRTAEKEATGFKKEAGEMRTLMGQHHADMLQNAQRAHEAEGKVSTLEMSLNVSEDTNTRLKETLDHFQESSVAERKAMSAQLEGLKLNGHTVLASPESGNDVGTLNATNEALQGTIVDLASETYELREQLQAREGGQPELHRQIRELQAQNQELEGQKEMLMRENQEIFQQKDEARMELAVSEEVEEGRRKMEHKMTILMAECDSLRQSLELSEMARKLSKQEMEKEQSQKREALSQFKELQRDCEELKAKLKEKEDMVYKVSREGPEAFKEEARYKSLEAQTYAWENRIIQAETRSTHDVSEEGLTRRGGDLLSRLRSKRSDPVQALQSSGVHTPGATDPQERFDAYARAKITADETWDVSNKSQGKRNSRFLSTVQDPGVSQGPEIDQGAFISHHSPVKQHEEDYPVKGRDDAMERKIAGFEEKFAMLRRSSIDRGNAHYTFAHSTNAA